MRRRLGAALLAALSCSLAVSAPAAARYDPLASGQTRLVLAKRFASFLGKDGVRLAGSGAAERSGRAIVLPVSGGLIDPTTGKGRIEADGVLVFSTRSRRLPFRQLKVETNHSPLIAKVGGGQLKLASAKQLSFAREGFGSDFQAKRLALSAKLVTRLNKKLRPKIRFQAGQLVGSIDSRTQPLTTTILERGRATLLFDPGFVAKLGELHVSLNPIFGAEHQGAEFTFPIVINGAISPDASQGILRTGGEVEFLQLGGGQVFWREPWFELGPGQLSVEADVQPSPPYEGKTARIAVAVLGQGAVSSDPSARTITDSGAPLALNAQSAKTFDEAFAEGKEEFRAGEALGTVSFVAQGQ